eukprot:jgi/Chrzof1/2057/Cz11g01100.t1
MSVTLHQHQSVFQFPSSELQLLSADVSLIIKPSSFLSCAEASQQAFLLKHGKALTTDEYQKANSLHRVMRVAAVSAYFLNGTAYYAALFIGEATSSKFHQMWGWAMTETTTTAKNLTEEGLCPSWINVFTNNNGTDRVTWLWEKPANGCPVEWLSIQIIGIDAFNDAFNKHVKAGYRASWVSGYGSNEHMFSIIWKKERSQEEWKMHHYMRAALLQVRIDTYRAQGLHPVLINGYAIKNTTWYVAIFEKVGDAENVTANFGMTEPEYQSYELFHYCTGYTPVHISAWTEGKEVRFAAIWKK